MTVINLGIAGLFLAAAGGYVLTAGGKERRAKVLTKPFLMPLLALF